MYTVKLHVSIKHSFIFSLYFGFTQFHRNSKINTLLSSNIDIPKYTGLLFEFFIYNQQILCEKLCSMIIWFWHQIFSFFFCCYKFRVPMFSNIFHSSSKNWVIDYLAKVRFKIIFCCLLKSVFISIYGFSHAFWISLITLCTFF